MRIVRSPSRFNAARRTRTVDGACVYMQLHGLLELTPAVLAVFEDQTIRHTAVIAVAGNKVTAG